MKFAVFQLNASFDIRLLSATWSQGTILGFQDQKDEIIFHVEYTPHWKG